MSTERKVDKTSGYGENFGGVQGVTKSTPSDAKGGGFHRVLAFPLPRCGMPLFYKLVLFVLRIEIPVRESIVKLDIHVRVLFDQYRLPVFFKGQR